MVQRHRARRLHYDLRFEIDGVLASWAVPKGPTLDPDVKHAAIHVEDHPIEYEDFEGVIPSGQYGGGDVIVWDTGTWDLHAADDAAEAVRDGELHADIYGEKLKGRFILIRTAGPRGAGQGTVAAVPQARRVRGQGLGPRGLPEVGAQRPDQRRGQGRPGPDVALRPAPVAGFRARRFSDENKGGRRAARHRPVRSQAVQGRARAKPSATTKTSPNSPNQRQPHSQRQPQSHVPRPHPI